MIIKNNCDLIIASNNKNKIREIRELFTHVFDNIYSLFDKGIDVDIEETGVTFEENSIIKAKAIAEMTGCYSLADDSGLEVYALGGEPGVYSARYAQIPCSDSANNEKLLANMIDITDRRAKFTSVVALCSPSGEVITAQGSVEGEIEYSLIGTGGFGYDPLFLSHELGETFGTATNEAKNTVSHRARALDKLSKLIII